MLSIGIRLLLLLAAVYLSACTTVRGTGDLGVVIERANGQVQVIDTSMHVRLTEIAGLGDLSHA